MKPIRKVAIIGGVRTPFVKSFTNYLGISNQTMMTATLEKLVEKYQLQGKLLGDVALGAVMTHPSDWGLARESVLGTSLHPNTPAYNLQRACGTSLEASNQIALKIACGQIEVGIAGGVDTNSDLPIMMPSSFSHKLLRLKNAKTLPERLKLIAELRPTDLKIKLPGVMEPRTKLSMGEHCELMVKEWKISREEQDKLAVTSQKNAAKAFEEGFFKDMMFEYKGVKQDASMRKDTTLEKISKLKPAFDRSAQGSLTAANSTPLTDGSSAALLCSEEYAQKNNLNVCAYFIDAEAAAVDFVRGEGLLMAPTLAVTRLLQRNNLTLADFDFYEIHEAFCGQVLCTLKAWEDEKYCKEKLGLAGPLGSIDRNKMNVKGGSVAIGHPFAATGTRILAGLAKMLSEKGQGRGLISICTAGGMGVAAIVER